MDEPLSELAPNYASRKQFTRRTWDKLTTAVSLHRESLGSEFRASFDFGCSYVTGSIARDEANKHSDLDLFIMDCFRPGSSGGEARRLDSLEQAHLLSTIDQARAQVGFRPFSQGGRFLTCHSFRKMVDAIGNAEDDFTNRFTARMLLLLNSRPLVNPEAYDAARDQVLERYWRQEPDENAPFYPVYLLNDIRRWWGIVLLNFEYHNPPVARGVNDESGQRQRADRRIANLKLRYARLLASYTPILAMLAYAEDRGVRRASMAEILEPSPLERLDLIRDRTVGDAQSMTVDLIRRYDEYLGYMDAPKEELRERVLGEDWGSVVKPMAYDFGDLVAKLAYTLGEGGPIYRYMIV